MDRIPNPGSPDAHAMGCTCTVLDNNHGRGAAWKDSTVFWINFDCQIHAIGPLARQWQYQNKAPQPIFEETQS